MRAISPFLFGLSLFLVGCSSGTGKPPAAEPSPASVEAVASPASSPEDELRATAAALSAALAAGDAEAAWEFYSRRCQTKLNDDIEVYRALMEQHYEGRNLQIESVIVRVDGSSAQVVTVDKDPAAPADSMDPSTWTFIDGRWQFDNC